MWHTPATVTFAPKGLNFKKQRMSSEIPKLLPKFMHKYVGNPVMFRRLKPLELVVPGLKHVNNAYTAAPGCKWALSIIPLYGIATGSTPVEKYDANTSASLACTGFVWTVYAMLIQPQNTGSRMLAAVNFAMGVVNGYKAVAKWNYDAKSA